MLRFFNKRIHNRKGFTLIELVVVIAILGILALIAIPRFAGIRDRAEIQADRTTYKLVYDAAAVAYHELDSVADADTIDATSLVDDGYLDKAPAYKQGPDPIVVVVAEDGAITVTEPTVGLTD